MLPTPAPPATMTFAFFRFTLRSARWLSSTSTQSRAGSSPPSKRTIWPVRPGSAAPIFMTPSRTVAICGRVSGLTMVAMMLPPKAGRIW